MGSIDVRRSELLAIINPRAGGMKDRKRWQELRNTLSGLGVKVEEKETKSRGHAELLAAQGRPVDIGGYFHADEVLAEQAMRPSATLNAIIDAL